MSNGKSYKGSCFCGAVEFTIAGRQVEPVPLVRVTRIVLNDEPAWLRVRPPLVALTPDGFRALEREIRAFGIDPESD